MGSGRWVACWRFSEGAGAAVEVVCFGVGGGLNVSAELLTTRVVRARARLVVHVAGDVDMESAPVLDSVLAHAGAVPPVVVVVDLAGVTYFGSAGLSVLIAAVSRCGEAGVSVVVVAPVGHIARRTIEVTGLAGVLGLVESLDHVNVVVSRGLPVVVSAVASAEAPVKSC